MTTKWNSIDQGRVWGLNFTLIEGNPMDPASTDIIMARGRLNVGEAVPNGWRVLTGNMQSSDVVTVGFREEMENWT
jgi:hypothetical protein